MLKTSLKKLHLAQNLFNCIADKLDDVIIFDVFETFVKCHIYFIRVLESMFKLVPRNDGSQLLPLPVDYEESALCTTSYSYRDGGKSAVLGKNCEKPLDYAGPPFTRGILTS